MSAISMRNLIPAVTFLFGWYGCAISLPHFSRDYQIDDVRNTTIGEVMVKAIEAEKTLIGVKQGWKRSDLVLVGFSGNVVRIKYRYGEVGPSDVSRAYVWKDKIDEDKDFDLGYSRVIRHHNYMLEVTQHDNRSLTYRILEGPTLAGSESDSPLFADPYYEESWQNAFPKAR